MPAAAPFEGERPISPSDRAADGFRNAFDRFETQTGLSPISPGGVTWSKVPRRPGGMLYNYIVARYGAVRTLRDGDQPVHWVWDDEREEWIEGAMFDANGYVLYPMEDTDTGEVFLANRDGERAEPERAPPTWPTLEELCPRRSAWERLADDPFG